MKSLLLFGLCTVFLAACGRPATATVTPVPTELPSPTQAQLPISTNTSLPSPTLTPLPGLTFCVVPNLLNLRSGPGLNYSIVVIEGQNTCGQATARNEDASWVFINFGKYSGWAFAQYLSGQGDLKTLPLSTTVTLTPPAASPPAAASPVLTP